MNFWFHKTGKFLWQLSITFTDLIKLFINCNTIQTVANYKFTSIFVWAQKMGSHLKGRTWTEYV